MTRLRLIAALLLAATPLAILPTPASADGAQAPLSRVLHEIAQRYPGKQLNTTMGQANGKPVYLVQWQLSDGRITVFTVDAQTGQILGQQGG